MKKISKLILSLLMILGVCVMVSCATKVDPEPTPTPTPTPTPVLKKSVSSIQLNTASVKKAYYLGEAFDKTNLVVTARFTDGTSEDVSAKAEVNTDGFDNQVVGTYPIIVSYEYEGRVRRNSFDVTVSSLAETIEKHIVGLEVEKTATEYAINTEVVLSDVTVTAVYSDDTTKTLTSEEFTIDKSLIDITKPNIYPLVFQYSEQYELNGASEEVNVRNFVLITINDPVKELSFVEGTRQFEYGSRFTTDDWKVQVTYESGATTTIDNTEFTFSVVDTFSAGEKTCNVYYREMGIEKSLSVTVTVLPNPNADYHIDKSIDVSKLGVTSGVAVESNRKQPLPATEVDDFFTLSGNVLKYFKSNMTDVSGVEIAQGSGITFTIEGTAKLTLDVSSNGSSNTSLLSVTNANGELQHQTTSAKETSTGLISIYSSSANTRIEFSLPAGTYTITFVSGIDDSTNVAVPTEISATRAGRIAYLNVLA